MTFTASEPGRFLYVGCQPGAETVCKQQMAEAHGELRLAFSRPGFLTFKSPRELPSSLEPQCAFARVAGLSCGRVQAPQPEALAELFWEHRLRDVQHLHVWQRQQRLRGEEEPEQTTGRALALLAEPAAESRLTVNLTARPGQRILDCVIVETDCWWIGLREAGSVPSRWPGGKPPLQAPPDMVSRAYLKTQEALLWSRLPLRAGELCVEIGSAPGGASQALLERGMRVVGIDPAEMDPQILAHPHFTHIRRRAAQVPRRQLAGARWLLADSNVAPAHTLDSVQALVTDRRLHVRGLLLTLKLPDWKLAGQIPEYLARVRGWGFQLVKPRHLYHNRQEICIAALRRRSMLREPSGRGERRAEARG